MALPSYSYNILRHCYFLSITYRVVVPTLYHAYYNTQERRVDPRLEPNHSQVFLNRMFWESLFRPTKLRPGDCSPTISTY